MYFIKLKIENDFLRFYQLLIVECVLEMYRVRYEEHRLTVSNNNNNNNKI